MSARAKTRKNAGEGYGYMFHGAFKDKKDAVAKERKTKGAWVKGVFTKQGHRYVVMSPRTNPIKRKKQNPDAVLKKAIAAFHKLEKLEAEGKTDRAWKMRMALARLNTRLGMSMAQLAEHARHGNRSYANPGGYFSENIDAGNRRIVIWANSESSGPFHLQPYMSGVAGREVGKYKTLETARKKAHAYIRKMGWADNPHELLIMGANPHHRSERDFTVPPGSTITIRMNPTEVNPDRYTSMHAQTSGRSYQAPGLIQTERQRRVAGMVRSTRRTATKHKYDWIPTEGIAPGQNPGDDRFMYAALAELYPGKTLGQLSMSELSRVAQYAQALKHPQQPRPNVELGTYENGVFHPWTRRPKSRQKKAIRRQNPSAERIREEFTGAPVEHEHVRHEPHMPAGDYAQLGKLLSLYVKPRTGGQVLEIRPTNVIVVSDESAQQLWFVGGDQDVTDSLAQFGALERGPNLYELGEARRIDYEQRKEHVPDPDQDHWRHSFGEETDVRPKVLFDRAHKRLMLEGGQYEIRREGIVN